jgi:hypothetical protein
LLGRKAISHPGKVTGRKQTKHRQAQANTLVRSSNIRGVMRTNYTIHPSFPLFHLYLGTQETAQFHSTIFNNIDENRRSFVEKFFAEPKGNISS